MANAFLYGTRVLGRALTADDPTMLLGAGAALAIAYWDETDYRDLMLKLAPLHVAATRLTGSASPTLDWIADRLPEHQRKNMRAWGNRSGITLEAFLHTETTTPTGTWITGL